MKFPTWIILIAYFALTDSAPTTRQPSNNLNFTNDINMGIIFVLKYYSPKWNGSYVSKEDTEGANKFYNQTTNGILHDVTVKFQPWSPSKIVLPSADDQLPPLLLALMLSLILHSHGRNPNHRIPPKEPNPALDAKVELQFNDNDTLMISGQLPSVFLEGYLRESNYRIVTEKFTLDFVVKITPMFQFIVEYPNFNQSKIKLLSNDYQHKQNEETQIKEEIETQIKSRFKEYFSIECYMDWYILKLLTTLLLRKSLLLYNKEERYYFIGTIPSTNYTLSNVTIYGLWNVRSISTNESNWAASPGLELGSVRGSLVQNFPSFSREIDFKVDNLYISRDRNTTKVNVKAESHSVVNAKLNTTLADDQSKFIIEEIESAFAASLQSAWEFWSERNEFKVQLEDGDRVTFLTNKHVN